MCYISVPIARKHRPLRALLRLLIATVIASGPSPVSDSKLTHFARLFKFLGGVKEAKRMGNGKRKETGNGKRETGNGKRETGNGKKRKEMGNEKLETGNEKKSETRVTNTR